MQIYLFVALILSTAGTRARAADTCRDGDRVLMPTAEFSLGDKHIFFVGLTHLGPKNYFARTKRTIDDYLRRVSAPVTILTEFMTCETSTLNIVANSAVDRGEVVRLARADAPADFMGPRISLERCVPDLDGRTTRPLFLVERNRDACAHTHAHGFECQWMDLKLEASATTTIRSGDVRLDAEPPATQVFASMAYRPWTWARSAEEGSKTWNLLFDEFILDRRNVDLVDDAIVALKTTNHVILPWGAAHLPGLKALLFARGFKQTAWGGVLYANRSHLGIWSEFDLAYPEALNEAVPSPGLCSDPS